MVFKDDRIDQKKEYDKDNARSTNPSTNSNVNPMAGPDFDLSDDTHRNFNANPSVNRKGNTDFDKAEPDPELSAGTGRSFSSNTPRGSDKEKNEPGKRNIGWAVGAVLLFMATKGKTLLAVLGKFAAPLLTMLASIGAYALVFPWGFSVGFVLLLLVHELGHVLAAKRKGLPVSAPVFIPFIGALINMKRHPRDAETEAYIALGGPVLGTIGAAAVFFTGLYFRGEWGQTAELLIVIANVGFFLNLINLLPIHPLDGGRIATAVTRWLWLIGLFGGLVVIIYLRSVLFFIIWALFAWDLVQKYLRKPKKQLNSLTGTVVIPVEGIELISPWIPGEEHRRELPFTTYSSLEDGKQRIIVRWPLLGLDKTFILPHSGLIEKAEVDRVRKEPENYPERLEVDIYITYEPYQPDDYYDVPVATRWKYGAAYAGLAVFLGFMMYCVHLVGVTF